MDNYHSTYHLATVEGASGLKVWSSVLRSRLYSWTCAQIIRSPLILLCCYYSTYAQVCVRSKHQLQLCRHPSILSPSALDVFKSMLAVEIMPTSLLHLKIWYASTVYLRHLTLLLCTIESPYTNLSTAAVPPQSMDGRNEWTRSNSNGQQVM